jgi:hypothetical protein
MTKHPPTIPFLLFCLFLLFSTIASASSDSDSCSQPKEGIEKHRPFVYGLPGYVKSKCISDGSYSPAYVCPLNDEVKELLLSGKNSKCRLADSCQGLVAMCDPKYIKHSPVVIIPF